MKRAILFFALGLAASLLAGTTLIRPSNNRDWITGQELLPRASFDGDRVTIRNVRNFTYAPDGTPTPHYETRSYDLDRIESAWFVLSPFSKERRGPAHTFLSFGFADSQYVAISVEARRERNEDYSILKGILRRFEIMYVIGDERDLIKVRTNVYGDDVYVYPILTERDKIRALFVQMLTRANGLAEEPEFYNTLTNNCTTNILKHANQISPGRIPYGREVLLPGYADQLAQRLGLIDNTVPIEIARTRFLVNRRALASADDPLFSLRIRQN